MKKLFASILSVLVLTLTYAYAATPAQKAYTDMIMDRLDEIVSEKTSTFVQEENLWKSISQTISKAIINKQNNNEVVDPILLLLETALKDKVFMLAMGDVIHESAPLFPNDLAALSELQQELLVQVNKLRADAGVAPLTINSTLTKLAQNHAEYMVNNDHFYHEQKDGTSPDMRVERAGYSWQFVGENIAQGQRSVHQVMFAWMNSRDHKQNILDSDFTEVGFGYYNDHWVQLFAAPKK